MRNQLMGRKQIDHSLESSLSPSWGKKVAKIVLIFTFHVTRDIEMTII